MYICKYGIAYVRCMGRGQEPRQHAQARHRFQRCGGPVLSLRDERLDYGEERWASLGWIRTLVGVVVHTERRGHAVRIISARKATKREAKYYVQRIEN